LATDGIQAIDSMLKPTTWPAIHPPQSHNNTFRLARLPIVPAERDKESGKASNMITYRNGAGALQYLHVPESDRQPVSWPRRQARKSIDISIAALRKLRIDVGE